MRVPKTTTIQKYLEDNCASIVGVPSKKVSSKFCSWYEEKYNTRLKLHLLVPDTKTTIKEYIKSIIQKERKSSWFKTLYKRGREEQMDALEERNQKIRKIQKTSDVEFFSDENILVYILQFADTSSLVSMRYSCSFFKTFITKHFKVILQNRNYLLNIRIWSQEQHIYAEHVLFSSDAKCYKQVCLISGVESQLVDSLVVARSSKVNVDKCFKVKQFVTLFKVTNIYFKHIFFVRWILCYIPQYEKLDIQECHLNGYCFAELNFSRNGMVNPFASHKVFYMRPFASPSYSVIDKVKDLQQALDEIHNIASLDSVTPMYCYIELCDERIHIDWERDVSSYVIHDNVRLLMETTSEIRILQRNQSVSISTEQAYQLSNRKGEDFAWLLNIAAAMNTSKVDAETLLAFH